MKITTHDQHRAALKEIEGLMHAEPGTPEGARLDALARAIEEYEARLLPLETSATLPPTHPGEMLREELLVPLDLTVAEVARACGMPFVRVEAIVQERHPIDARTAVRLARYFGTSAEFWLKLQMRHDLQHAQRDLAVELEEIEPLKTPDRD